MKKMKESPLAAAVRASLRQLLDEAPLTPARAARLAQVARKGADLLGAVEGHRLAGHRRLGVLALPAGGDDDDDGDDAAPVSSAETFGATAIREMVSAATALATRPVAAATPYPPTLTERLLAIKQARDLGIDGVAEQLESTLRREFAAAPTTSPAAANGAAS